MTIYKQSSRPRNIGIIGYGAIGKVLAESIVAGKAGNSQLVAVLRQSDVVNDADYLVINDEDQFFSQSFDLVIEAAGHEAVLQFAERTFKLPADFLITSIGALTDEALQTTLIRSAQENDVRFLLGSGALPGIDWMSSVSETESTTVTISQEKPLASWRGTPAESLIDLKNVSSAQCFFEGSAREAASQFPRSSNITAMLAISTVGMDATIVKLVVDPDADKMRTVISCKSELGELELIWHGIPTEANPRTSRDVAFTVIKALRNLTSPMVIGV